MEVIPKIIHYCWFGKGKKSELIKSCFKSWKYFLPDYEIKCWDETNVSFDNDFVLQAYKLKNWAFVSDYIRLKVIYDYGGIYLDTDMMVVKNFDSLLENSCFFGLENKLIIGTAIIGSVKKHLFINKCLEDYKTIKKIDINTLKEITSPKIITRCFKQYYKFNENFENQLTLKDITIFSEDFFYPLPSSKKYNNVYEKYILSDTYSIHLWATSWIDDPAFKLIREGQYLKGLKNMFKEMLKSKTISLFYLRKIVSSFKQSILNGKYKIKE